jgi:hypothetical protein
MLLALPVVLGALLRNYWINNLAGAGKLAGCMPTRVGIFNRIIIGVGISIPSWWTSNYDSSVVIHIASAIRLAWTLVLFILSKCLRVSSCGVQTNVKANT